MYLLDTHIFIWFLEGNENLSASVREIIESENNQIFVSVASIWELAIKQSIGKITLLFPIEEMIENAHENQIDFIDVNIPIALKIRDLPDFHHDPFDRIIISTAIINDLTLISRDKIFNQYNVKMIFS
jgi:PIN domain nuclease of toxin-antitoxin system